MYKKLLTLSIAALLWSCNTPTKDSEVRIASTPVQKSHEDFKDYTDTLGEKLSISENDENDSKTIKYNGNIYILKKDLESNTYSTSDNEYQLSETRNEITFLKKDYNMVLFKTKKNSEQATTQMQ